MKKENESVKKLEVGKDYISEDGLIVIDRLGGFRNRGFNGNNFEYDFFCSNSNEWREATKEEVIEAFKKHLVYRYGEDWETMKIKEARPNQVIHLNKGLWSVEICKINCKWRVFNKNGLLYCNGIWVERLEEDESTDSTPALQGIDETKIKIKPSKTQIGGSHYSNMAIQPTEFIHKNNLSFIQGNIIKYVCRYKSKNGVEDLDKAKHYIDLLIEFEKDGIL